MFGCPYIKTVADGIVSLEGFTPKIIRFDISAEVPEVTWINSQVNPFDVKHKHMH